MLVLSYDFDARILDLKSKSICWFSVAMLAQVIVISSHDDDNELAILVKL